MTIDLEKSHRELYELLGIAVDFKTNPEGVGYEAAKAFIDKAETALKNAEKIIKGDV